MKKEKKQEQEREREQEQMATMNLKQKQAFDAFFRRENLFLTGSAGTGKSFTLGEICKAAARSGYKVGVTATTGSAAHLIKGRTIHSFLGIGLARGTPAQLAAHTAVKNKAIAKKICGLDVLVIEEVSMMDQEFFEKVSEYLSIIRKNKRPFGGLQIMLLGDFCQLPPVSKGGGGVPFCFRSEVWAQLNLTTVMLTELVRQIDDPDFQRVLEAVRWGSCDEETFALLKSWIRRPGAGGEVRPTRLYSTNVDVDTINNNEYDKLIAQDPDVERRSYETVYGSAASKAWAKSCKVPEYVRVCVGAQVVVTWNVNQACGIVNGTRGIVVEVGEKCVTIKDVCGRLMSIEMITMADGGLAVTYMPLRLAYALTIHRCQGMTLDSVVIDLGASIFEYGQAYTALSRVRNSASVSLVAVEAASFRCHPDVLEFYRLG